VEQFASGWKQHYYGKGDVIVYRLNRDGRVPEGQSPLFGAACLCWCTATRSGRPTPAATTPGSWPPTR
jgi:hypothetical protein